MFINVDSVQIKTLLVNNDTTKEIVNTLKVLKLGAGNHLQQNDYVSRFYIWFLHNINISFFFNELWWAMKSGYHPTDCTWSWSKKGDAAYIVEMKELFTIKVLEITKRLTEISIASNKSDEDENLRKSLGIKSQTELTIPS